MGKKRQLDREIKITVSRENMLNISKRKLKKAKAEKHLIHKTVLIQNTIKLLKNTEVEHEILNNSPTKCDEYDTVNFYHRIYNTIKRYVRRFFSTRRHFLIS